MLVSFGKNYSKDNFINLLFAIIPLSFIAGNLVINLNILAILLFSIIFYGINIFKIRLNLIDKLIVLFFVFLLYTSIYNNIVIYITEDWPKNFAVTKKAFLFLRYLALYFIIRFLVKEKIFNFKIFLFQAFFLHICKS